MLGRAHRVSGKVVVLWVGVEVSSGGSGGFGGGGFMLGRSWRSKGCWCVGLLKLLLLLLLLLPLPLLLPVSA